ncbi:gluconate 2-dehydrogenase subunit 3 family protein [Halorubrum sp. BOL3-1]|uniref:gluconate 2-dehydrogenase subunit 3 family protein n=1 Tax=Halorubrum sp. BOL3-1 TaxID=2497325 RepID=UPI001005114F|nr:gluconate 2-dehydrogenase subunit 3 family protein [Halorubrum sp. BOL3-1]QAU13124.1 gluconate 2-dehydrogenase subunit 3 family protein [Halorubrum sp. BOL3-1]
MTDNHDHELTRRDAISALAAVGIAGGGAVALSRADGDETDETNGGPPYGPIEERDLAVLTATAEVVYPSAVDGIEGFVVDFVRGRASDRPEHAAAVADAAGHVRTWTRSWFDAEFAELAPDRREAALDRMGVREADPNPGGTDTERVRYYVVNELLLALYASPTGGELVGIENPQGHPGGADSYTRGPQ